MRINPSQLEGHLRRGLAPAYLLCGDEPLQLTEAFDAITDAAHELMAGAPTSTPASS